MNAYARVRRGDSATRLLRPVPPAMLAQTSPEATFDSGPFDPAIALALARVIDPEAFGLADVKAGWMKITAARQVAHATALRVLVTLARRGDLAGSEPWRADAAKLAQSPIAELPDRSAEIAALLSALIQPAAYRPSHHA